MASDLVMPIIGDAGKDGNFEGETSTQQAILTKIYLIPNHSWDRKFP